MRIYGGRDYYDSALAFGSDPTVVLTRYFERTLSLDEKAVPPLPRLELNASAPRRSHCDTRLFHYITVAFGPKLYHGVGVPEPVSNATGTVEYLWSAAKLHDWAERNGMRVQLQRGWRDRKGKTDAALYFAVEDTPPPVRDYMIAHRIAILVDQNQHNARDPELRVNPFGLKQLGFAKALDPYSAYQELSMWVGGVLGGVSPEIVAITDNKVLLENHGYDKFSFRSQERP